jgi:parallel beta-helix repeat protein
VGSSAELQAALNAAMPGDVIELEPGTYSASLEDGTRLLMQDKAGTTTYPIVICGPQTAVLDGNSAASTNVNRKLRDALIDKSFAEPGALVLRRVSHVHIRGLTFANGRMGLMLLEASNCKVSKTIVRRIDITGISGHSLTSCTISDSEIFEVHRGVILNYSMGCTLSNLRVYNTGNVGIKLQRNSTYNTITKCYITGALFMDFILYKFVRRGIGYFTCLWFFFGGGGCQQKIFSAGAGLLRWCLHVQVMCGDTVLYYPFL